MASRTVICALVGALLLSIVSFDSAPAGHRNLFAFVTANEFFVMDGEKEVAREEILYEYHLGGIVWSLDGRYASLISASSSGADLVERELVSIDAQTGEVRRFSCAYCSSIAPIGESSILVTQNGKDSLYLEGILRLDMESDGVPVALAADDLLINNSSRAKVFAGSKEYALAISPAKEGDDLFTIHADGTAQRVEPSQQLPVQHQIEGVQQNAVPRGIGEVSIVYANDGSPYFAVTSVLKPSLEGCVSSHAVFLVQPETGSVLETDISDLHLQDRMPTVDGYARIIDLWWEINGQLHAVMLSGSCDETLEESAVPPSVWRLTRGEWEKVDGRIDRVMGMRHLGQNSRLVISGADAEDALAGDLYIEYGAAHNLIASEVLEVEVPGVKLCELGSQGADVWCEGFGEIDYGTPHSNAYGGSQTPKDSPTESPSRMPSQSPFESECSSPDFASNLQDMDYLVEHSDIEVICRGGFAYVQITGDGPMIYDGTQDLIFSSSSDGWILLGGGPGSGGQFLSSDIESLGLDPYVIDDLFPEMDLMP